MLHICLAPHLVEYACHYYCSTQQIATMVCKYSKLVPHQLQLVLTKSNHTCSGLDVPQGAVKAQSWAGYCLRPSTHSVGVIAPCKEQWCTGARLTLNHQMRIHHGMYNAWIVHSNAAKQAHHPSSCIQFIYKITAIGKTTSGSYKCQTICATIYEETPASDDSTPPQSFASCIATVWVIYNTK